jgi:hypothetical protein
MQAKLTPCESLKQLIKCAKSTRESNDAISHFNHELLPLVHRFNFDQRRALIKGYFGGVQKRRDNPSDMTITLDNGASEDPHEAYAAPSIDQVPPSVYDGMSDTFSCCLE